jgi:hypothetical protein
MHTAPASGAHSVDWRAKKGCWDESGKQENRKPEASEEKRETISQQRRHTEPSFAFGSRVRWSLTLAFTAVLSIVRLLKSPTPYLS